jgi:dTDP-4-amino-4,6-dideoxygalactose transaminase
VSTHTQVHVPFVDLNAQYRSIKEEIAEAIDQVLESARFVGGPWVENFEDDFARFVGCKYAIGMSSGTSALELALKSAGIGPGDEVVVPAFTFFATAEAVSNVGAKPVFADVDPETFHLDVASAERALTSRTRAIICVHLYGRAMDLAPYERLAAHHDLLIIEDAAQAHGAERAGVRVGGSGRLTCFSFYPSKNLGAYGDAGAVTTNDEKFEQKLRLLRDHGSRSKYEHTLIGTNARLDAIQAAILSVKIRHLDEWNCLRVKHATRYASMLKGTAMTVPAIPADGEHVFHLMVVRTPRRDQLKAFLALKNIECGIHYRCPLHLTSAYQALGYLGRGSLPVSEQLADELLSLPMYAELTPEMIDYTVEALCEFETQTAGQV